MSLSRFPFIRKAKYSLWVSDRDEAGAPVDPRFIQAAYAMEKRMFSYRKNEVGCESMTSSLIQSSVVSASRAAQVNSVSNPEGYLWRTYTRKVDRHLANAEREVSVQDDFMEDLSSRSETIGSTAELLENQILLEQVKKQMDDWTRRVLNMRIAGYSWEEIAKDLCLSANVVTVRYVRGVSRAADRLLNRRATKGQVTTDAK